MRALINEQCSFTIIIVLNFPDIVGLILDRQKKIKATIHCLLSFNTGPIIISYSYSDNVYHILKIFLARSYELCVLYTPLCAFNPHTRHALLPAV